MMFMVWTSCLEMWYLLPRLVRRPRCCPLRPLRDSLRCKRSSRSTNALHLLQCFVRHLLLLLLLLVSALMW